MKTNRLALAVATALIAISGGVHAQTSCSTLFGVSVTVSNGAGGSGSVCSNTAQGMLDAFDKDKIQNMQGIQYTDTEAVSLIAKLNGVNLTASFDAGTTTLRFAIPALQDSQVFTGATRDDSVDKLTDYLKHSDIIGRIMKEQAASSPTSPIAGQGGLIPNAIALDFNSNFTDTATYLAGRVSSPAGGANNLIGLSAVYASYKTGDTDLKSVSIPLSYTIRNDLDPRRQLAFSLPLTVVDVDGAKSYQGSLGVTYRLPITDNWSLAPGGRYSFIGSSDLAAAAALTSFTLSSMYLIEAGGVDVGIGNMLGKYTTRKFKAGDYSFDPDIDSTVMRNGVVVSHPVQMGSSRLTLEYGLSDTRYIGGDKPFADNSQELTIALGTNKSAFDARSFFRAALGYTQAKETKGVSLTLSSWF